MQVHVHVNEWRLGWGRVGPDNIPRAAPDPDPGSYCGVRAAGRSRRFPGKVTTKWLLG